MIKERLIKKAKNNKWEIVENCGGGVNITIPWEEWNRIYKKLLKNTISFKWCTTWNYKEVILSLF